MVLPIWGPAAGTVRQVHLHLHLHRQRRHVQGDVHLRRGRDLLPRRGHNRDR